MENARKRTVVITGATSGIGKSTARMFAWGAKVVLIGRNEDKCNLTKSQIESDGGEADFFICDLTNAEDIVSVCNDIKKKYINIDVLFNNAGIMLQSKEIERFPYDEWRKTFDTNINAMFLVTSILKENIYACKGCIINNASIAGMHSYSAGRSYAYSASKAAVIQFTRQMAKNYAEDGVRVNCICPGIIDTPILGDRDRNEYAKRIPLGYVAKPEEVAKVVCFLASEDAAYLTGVVLPVDGGASL
jgi:NAD(P)-dependent dehydrogenase (short-subunit alcohol dehydrogenase family)